MIIGIDGNEANESIKVGVHQYAFHILWALYKKRKIMNSDVEYLIYLKKPPGKELPKETNFWHYEILQGKGMWLITKLLPHLLIKNNLNVFFSPSHYLLPFLQTPQVCTIHDLGYLKFTAQFRKKDYWQLKYWTAMSISISKYIISVSQSTRKDIVRQYPKAAKKCSVIYHGYDSKHFNITTTQNVVRQIKKKYSIKGDYVLYLGTLKPSKNVEGLIEAFSKINPDRKTILVIAGKKGWLYESIFKKTKEMGIEERVLFTDYINEVDKPALFSGAKVFVQPSFWEGFGMDVVNSMACGTPVILSNVASLPEVGGEAGVYVDPYNIDSIAKSLDSILKMDSKSYNQLVKLGLKQSKKFSWIKSAEETLEVLKRAAG